MTASICPTCSDILTSKNVYKLILNDPEILNKCHELDPRDSRNIYSVFSDAAGQLEALDDDYFKQRSEDILSIGKELILTMQGAQSNNIDDEEMLKTFNCGVGFCLIVNPKNLNKITKFFTKEFKPYVIGKITAEKYKVKLHGKIDWS